MKVGYKKLGLVMGAVAALAILPARADAQVVRYSPIFWSFEGNGGIAIPLGDLSDVASSGPSFGIAAGYYLNPRLVLRAEASVDLLGEGDGVVSDPSLQVWHYTGGLEYHIADPTQNLLFAFDIGVGGTTFDTDVFTVMDYPNSGDTTTGNFSNTYLATNAGLKVGYNFWRHSQTNVPMATIFLQGDFHLMFADEDNTEAFAALSGQTSGFGTVYEVPITAGIRFNIP